ncbi:MULTISPECIES: heavy-metal-associated domain-containing protein [unclassified Pseudoxanthomonas]|uniref:heavy-metal-associated domain-containing protein n=1 Tax=unclassified Pseudoxanthomonas TaxID=2645906 RepID=UPI0016162A0E|nr:MULTISPECIES: heavy-metal-associated domain-containing protein [unclassified Pseudoxanthomonas]MBB3274238.1 copper chaperone [Pseudoxanthomonas sp. OG2]MBD9377887.1 cation transporter [Pseudoxanthomonas sp. PXM04]MBV7474749.1 heavy-metal-associated domain-containing protein [Pseudoxanthomonas sp. PXM05]
MKLIVEGMTCGHCVRTVTYALQALDANASVSVDLPGKTVLVRGDIRAAEATQALAAQGYDVIATDEAVAAAPAESGSQCCGSCKAA